ncbi:hypothetical protein CRENBAI_010728 [Crenichthys baileyi]|uniref:Uncharacterized protein n=1 Tax=Crenichthys baileyi TaxID=28760 RepID=A0AAV9RRV3_9TELE
MVWLMTYAALFHYTAASPDASSCETQSPPFRSPWLAAQRWNGEFLPLEVIIQGPQYVPDKSTYEPPNTLQDTVSCSRCGISAPSPQISVGYALSSLDKDTAGGMYLPIISCPRGNPQDRFWLPTLHLLDGELLLLAPIAPFFAPGTDAKGCQVSITTADGSTQTSVTTKSVTCQTSACDDEEQHQPASLEELISQTSATSDAMQTETGPPQLSDGLLAEVMTAIPPQPSPPLRPYPQSSRLCIALLRPSHMDGSGSPQLKGFPHYLSSRRSLYHLPF